MIDLKKASKILAVFLSCMMIMTGCGLSQQELSEAVTEATSLETTSAVMESDEADTTSETYSVSEESKEENVPLTYTDVVPEFSDLSDENLLKYVEDNIYSGIVDELNSDDYFVEEVSAVYVSKEYLEELEYNSRANIFFGYTLEDVENTFSGERFVFTLGEDGTTIVKPFEDYDGYIRTGNKECCHRHRRYPDMCYCFCCYRRSRSACCEYDICGFFKNSCNICIIFRGY